MRSLALVLVLAASACTGIDGAGESANPPGDDNGSDFGSGMDPGAFPSTCEIDDDCVLGAATCCECPTFALPASQNQAACGDVECPPMSCPNNVEAVCGAQGTCGLRCLPMQCDLSCDHGFVIDATGCLTCECAAAPANACDDSSNPCVEVPADCCGCARGGEDTAVPASDVGSFEDGLGCPKDPLCPENGTCTNVEPACVQGRCELLGPFDQDPPANACGLAADPACPPDEVCTINAVSAANVRGVGVCLAPAQ